MKKFVLFVSAGLIATSSLLYSCKKEERIAPEQVSANNVEMSGARVSSQEQDFLNHLRRTVEAAKVDFDRGNTTIPVFTNSFDEQVETIFASLNFQNVNWKYIMDTSIYAQDTYEIPQDYKNKPIYKIIYNAYEISGSTDSFEHIWRNANNDGHLSPFEKEVRDIFVNDVAIFRNEPEKFSYIANVYQIALYDSELLNEGIKEQLLFTIAAYSYTVDNFEGLFGQPARFKVHPCVNFLTSIVSVGLSGGVGTLAGAFGFGTGVLGFFDSAADCESALGITNTTGV